MKKILAMVSNNNNYKAVIQIKNSLVKERCSMKNSKIGVPLNIGNDLQLQRKWVRVR